MWHSVDCEGNAYYLAEADMVADGGVPDERLVFDLAHRYLAEGTAPCSCPVIPAGAAR